MVGVDVVTRCGYVLQMNDVNNKTEAVIDDQRTVTVTVAKLKAYEAAGRALSFATIKSARTADALALADAADKEAVNDLERARDAFHDAVNALYGREALR